MSAYLIAMVRVDDPETYRKYTAETPAIIARHGGKFLVRGGAVEALEGEEFRDRLVVLEFPSKDHVQSFYASPEYQSIVKHRHDSSESRFLLAEGAPGDGTAPQDRVEKSG